MGISESIMNHTITRFENICEEVDCEIKSCCCETKYSNTSPKRKRSKDNNNENSGNDNHSVISEK